MKKAELDRIAKLYGQPGAEETSVCQYGGYVAVDQNKETSMFYYFAEAANHPATKPLVLWLNGDVAGVVLVTGTRYGIAAMNLKVEKSFVVEYKGLSFVTVRGAGHMVPQIQPCRAFALFKNFLNGVVTLFTTDHISY
ncbi:hypothetical protein MIMGU_mgv1a019398mg [Erythranthe guttata]|uniref:Uncharacterized protein n=1 Tax=Erythranthe guttata TaxID=4155 RepID=A0A022RDF6_ERYGU|nr:hypothetical protein MIMGU_mgv1a019398mg [Erythranthe guttata]